MPRPICVRCQVEMNPKKNGFIVELMASDKPYQKWHSDLFECPSCGVEIVVGFGKVPKEAWMSHYDIDPADLRFWCSLLDKARAK